MVEETSVDFSKLTRDYEEITVPAPWGHIAGKWWGPRDVQPVLAMHGWQENANAWDPLMNLMPADISFLAVDMPGNGRSSHYPDNPTWFHASEDLVALRVLIRHFQWSEPVTFLSHSYSTGQAYMYAASYPEEVKKVISIDMVTPVGISMERFASSGGARLDKIIDIVDKKRNRAEKTLEQHADDYSKATNNSISAAASKHILERSMKRTDSNLFRSTRDGRVSIRFYFSFPNDFLLEMGKRIRCEYYVILATLPIFTDRVELMFKTENVLREGAKRFEIVKVNGTHHVHIDHPERVLKPILRWLRNNDQAEIIAAQPNVLNKGKI
ncbi:probable serine hydrolase [Neocloeon triangulifer]|uniref:probable serine hydrolase n=1 Tax=Neocloeon triangulifer TaxID=2078957 RepID=UPI00286EF5A0|nr:probable serine hydrolase [Neocloeon triangulifer]